VRVVDVGLLGQRFLRETIGPPALPDNGAEGRGDGTIGHRGPKMARGPAVRPLTIVSSLLA